MPLRARFRLARLSDGSVGAEIITPRQLGTQEGRLVGRGCGTYTPAEYLADSRLGLAAVRHPPDGGDWRYVLVRVWAQVPRLGQGSRTVVDRLLDFSQHSEERVLAADLARQSDVTVRWVRDDVTLVHALPDRASRERWLEAHSNSEGVAIGDWVRETAAWAARSDTELTEWPRGASRFLPRRKRRTAAPPAAAVPFFARRSGAVPREGRPMVAGVRLPRGYRLRRYLPAYWASDEEVPDVGEVAGRLAQAFPQTGVWPLVWSSWEDPGSTGPVDPGGMDNVNAIDVAEVLRRGWSGYAARHPDTELPFGGDLPSLAPATPDRPGERWNPFWHLPSSRAASGRLLLVPCNRPADAMRVMGDLGAINSSYISAVLRSWEERFAAVPIDVEPGRIWLAAGAPPRERGQAELFVAEYRGFSELEDLLLLEDVPSAHDLVMTLIGPDESPRQADLDIRLQRRLWPIGWNG